MYKKLGGKQSLDSNMAGGNSGVGAAGNLLRLPEQGRSEAISQKGEFEGLERALICFLRKKEVDLSASSEENRDQAAAGQAENKNNPAGWPETLKIWPLVGLAASQSCHGGAWRVWALARAVDLRGSGVVEKKRLYRFLEDIGAHPRTRRRWVAEAKDLGILQEARSEEGKRVYYYRSLGKAAAALGADQIGRPAVLEGPANLIADQWAAWVWAGFLAAKNGYSEDPRPISQQTKQDLTGVAPRTQRRYQRQAGVKAVKNYAPRLKSGEHAKNAADISDITGLVFFEDQYGRLNQRLPDTVFPPGCVDVMPRGRGKKAQRVLNNHSSNERRGSFMKNAERLYFPSLKAARRAHHKKAGHDLFPSDCFYPQKAVRYISKKGVGRCLVWQPT